MKDFSKISIIYIAGTGRCGSTILDLLLDTHSQVFSVGELQNLYWEYSLQRRCACGEIIDRCSLWKDIIEKHKELLGEEHVTYFRASNRGKVIRWTLLPAILKGNQKAMNMVKIKDYGKENWIVLNSVIDKAQHLSEKKILYLVDSSKDPYRLLWLQLSGYFDIKVIHLYKNPKAFVYSMIKRRKGFDRWVGTVRFAIRWAIENKLIQKVYTNFINGQAIRICYRDLAEKPEKVLDSLFKQLRLSSELEVVKGFRSKNHHSVAGNKTKFENTEIVLDDKWEGDLSWTQKILIEFLTSKWFWKHELET
jgi:hypothetical protein